MKTLSLILLTLFVGFSSKAQECSSYFNFTKGAKAELVSYDKKDKVVARMNYTITDFTPVNGGFSLAIATETYDSKGTLLAKGDSFGKCNNGDYQTDIKNISSQMIPKSADIKMNIEGDQMVYPKNMKAGDKLPDASFKISSSIAASGMTILNVSGKIRNRQVEGTETVETPAGKFECLKISYDMDMKFMGNRTYKTVEYLAKNVGVVKQVQFNDKGKQESSLILTKLTR